MQPNRDSKLTRTLRAFIVHDEFLPANLGVGLGAYYYGERPWPGEDPSDKEHRLYWCSAHERSALLSRFRGNSLPWSSIAHKAGCQRPRGACVIQEIDLQGAEKDTVEIFHRGELVRRWFIAPDVMRDQEDVMLYRLLRERGDDPDTARNTILGLGHRGVDRLIAQLTSKAS